MTGRAVTSWGEEGGDVVCVTHGGEEARPEFVQLKSEPGSAGVAAGRAYSIAPKVEPPVVGARHPCEWTGTTLLIAEGWGGGSGRFQIPALPGRDHGGEAVPRKNEWASSGPPPLLPGGAAPGPKYSRRAIAPM